MNEKNCKVLAAQIRLETLKVIHSRGFGHVGGSMDLADLMAVLYGEVMKFDPKNPRWEDRDWMVLSKGTPALWPMPPTASWVTIPWRRPIPLTIPTPSSPATPTAS